MNRYKFACLLASLSWLAPLAWGQPASSPAASLPAEATQPAAVPSPRLEAIRPDEWVFWDQPRYVEELQNFLQTNYFLSEAQMASLRPDLIRLNTERNKAMPEYTRQMQQVLTDLDAWRTKLAKEGTPDREAFDAIMAKKWTLRSTSPASPLMIIDRVEAQLSPAELDEVLRKRSAKARDKMNEIRKLANVPVTQPSEEDRRREEDRLKTEKQHQELEDLRKKNAEILSKRATLTPPASMPGTLPASLPTLPGAVRP